MALKLWCANCCEDVESAVVAKKGGAAVKTLQYKRGYPAIGNNIASQETMLQHRI